MVYFFIIIYTLWRLASILSISNVLISALRSWAISENVDEKKRISRLSMRRRLKKM